MFHPRILLIGFALLSVVSVLSAQAQYHDAEEPEANGDASVASLGVKISELQEQIRTLEGKIEQVSFENKQLKAQLEKSNGDIQFRLTALEKKSAVVAASSPAPAAEATLPDSSQLRPVESENPGSENGNEQAPPHKFATAHELYAHALALLNHEAKYAEAGDEFAAFTKQYPKDPLVGNAYYWLGDTQYARRDYMRAADSFRQGYEAMPAGPKASENLLKLAMSLDALNKDKEACVVLKQVVSKFGNASPSVKSRAEQEINRIGCN